MKQKLEKIISDLKIENNNISIELNTGNNSDYKHIKLLHSYNNTLDIIKRLEKIIN